MVKLRSVFNCIAKKELPDLPNDFAHLPNDIIRDIMDENRNPQSCEQGLFDNLITMKGPWGAIARNYSYLTFGAAMNTNVFGVDFTRTALQSGKREQKLVDVDQLKDGELVRRMKRIYNCRSDHDYHSLFTRLYDELRINIIGDLPSNLDCFLTAEQLLVRTETLEAIIGLLKARRFRKFDCGFATLSAEQDVQLTHMLCEFVSQPNFEWLCFRSSTNGAPQVVNAAIKAWRERQMIELLTQKVEFHSVPDGAINTWRDQMKREWQWQEMPTVEISRTYGLGVPYQQDRCGAWVWEEKHPTDKERFMKIVIKGDSLIVYFRHMLRSE
ncbi:hypothetical protein QR680_004111 [Steinernema hermaphroditum]|uniref:Uncharacterized protein n=1 Tax=Steinernema hermaphroditum TaxID=289476 RepID=A0AA39HPV9_9BILA|nr:hypothetical protein QR680_004111 [Steinernema hermaphroditum]